MWEEDYARRVQRLPLWTRVAAYGKRGQHFSQLLILKTTVSGQITTPSTFAFALCWYPFLWNCILKTLYWSGLVPASLSDWVRNYSLFYSQILNT